MLCKHKVEGSNPFVLHHRNYRGSSEEDVNRVKNGNIRARGNLRSKLDN